MYNEDDLKYIGKVHFVFGYVAGAFTMLLIGLIVGSLLP